jgi:peroxiredoxin
MTPERRAESLPGPESHAAPDPAPIVGAPRRAVLLAGLAALGIAGALTGAWWLLERGRGPERLPALAYPIIDGRSIGPEQLAGRVVLVNFWATSCAVCVAEMPELAQLYVDYRARGLELLAVAMPYDRADRVLHFAQQRRLPFPVALDPVGAAVAAWGGVEGTPLTWLVAPDGRVVARWLGRPDFRRVRREIERLLPQATPAA